MAVFTLTSLAAGLAGSGGVLIASRAVQGVGAVLLMPTTLAIIMATFTNVRERNTAIGIWAAVSALALALGPVLGGLISQHLHWGWIGAVLRTRQASALRAGTDPVHAFVDGYHLGLLVTILLLAAGVVVSFVTLRPRAAAATLPTAGPASVPAARESAAVAELTTIDELAGELMVAKEMAP